MSAKVFLIVSLLIMSGLADAQFKAEPITSPDATYELEGYSVHAPKGEDWFLIYQDKKSVSFGKKKISPTHAFTVTATSERTNKKIKTLAEIVAYVKKGNAASIDPQRETILKNDAVTDEEAPAPLCAGYRLKTEDRGVPGTSITLLKLSYGIVCVHPTAPNLLVDVGYSERGTKDELNSEPLEDEGVDFVNSLKFSNAAKTN
jgi:hypothetical protein